MPGSTPAKSEAARTGIRTALVSPPDRRAKTKSEVPNAVPSVRDASASATPTTFDAPRLQPQTMEELVLRHRAAREAGRARRAALRTLQGPSGALSSPTGRLVENLPQPSTGEPLGKRETEFPPPAATDDVFGALTSAFVGEKDAKNSDAEDASEEVRRQRQKDRFANRRVLWKISNLKSVRACGRGVIDHDQGVTFKRRDGRVYTSGTTRCHSIWCCPVDAAKIRVVRARDASEACVRHIEAGGTAYLVTLTARHYKRHGLADLMDAITTAFKGLTSGAQWAGDKARGREGERKRMGVVGIIRSTEVTHSERNGWHPHLHLIVLMGAIQNERPEIPRLANRPEGWVKPEWDPTPIKYFPVPDPSWDRPELAADQRQTIRDFKRMKDRWDRTWANWLGDHGFRPSKKHGVRWDRIDTVHDAKNMGEYIAKIQEGTGKKKRQVAVGNEVARLDMKSGAKMRGGDVTSRTPFEMLDEYRQLRALDAETAEKLGIDVDARLARTKVLWHEYETATKRRRAIEWSRYLRDALGMGEEIEDQEIVEAEEGGDGFATVDTDTWRRICRLGLDYEITMAAELGGFAGLVVTLAELGLTASKLEPPTRE